MIMRRLILLFVAVVVSATAMAQSVDAMVESLSRRTISGSHVRVVEDSDTRNAVSVVESKQRTKVASGFRIVIYSDNGQYAGDNADNVLTEFKTQYPHINAYLVYESPYFKVSVGDCLSMEEAQILMAKIVGNYPKAFPRRESIALEALTRPQAPVIEVTDSLVLTPLLLK